MIRTLALILLIGSSALAQSLPNAVPMPGPEIQYLDSTGKPLAGGKLCTYTAGTNTPLATYTDSTAGTPNANPVVLNVAGRASVWVGPQLYKFVLRSGGDGTCTTGTIQWTQDNVADTTLYFANYVKTVGTSTLITYTAPFSGAVQRTVSSKLSDEVSVKDFGATGDGVTDDTVAIQAAMDVGYGVFFPAGTYNITASITIATPVAIRCDSKTGTTIKPSSLSGYLFPVTFSGEGFSADGCTFDMTSVGTRGVFHFNGQTWPEVRHNKFTYPVGGTGKAIFAENTGFLDANHNYFINPGRCVEIDGDGGLEDQITDSRCDSAQVGIKLTRTTTTDVGALYISNVQVVNSNNRGDNQSIVLTGTTINTAAPVQITATVGDNALGGPGLTVTNIVQTSVVNSWFTSATAAIRLEGTAEFRAVGNQNFQASQYGIAFYGLNVSTLIENNKIYGATYGLYIDAGATFNGLQVGNNLIDGVAQPLTNNLAAIMHAGTPGGTPLGHMPLTSSGQMMWVDDSVNIGSNSAQICTVKPGVTLPCKYITVNQPGNLVFFGNDATANDFTIIDPANGGGISIGRGASISFWQSAVVAAVNFGVISANHCVDVTGVAFVGAAAGDTLLISPSSGFMTKACGGVASCLTAHAFVTGADTITLRGCNVSTTNSANTGAQNFRVDLIKH